MSIPDELKELENLHRNGSLTDAEFAQAKDKLLAGPNSSPGEQSAQQLAEVRFQNELTRIDREWESDREKYYIKLRGGRRQLPTVSMAIRSAALGGVVGLVLSIFAGAYGDVCFSVWGVVMIVGSVGIGIYIYFRAQEYERALAAYQSRRNAIIEGFQSPGESAPQGEEGQYSIPNYNHRRTNG